MMTKYICYFILVTFVHAESIRCRFKTQSGELYTACCSNYEVKGNDCIPCSVGYTSRRGQSCKPCSGNSYGYKCVNQCFCSGDNICNHVIGCVKPSSPTNTLEYAMSYTTTSPGNLDETSNGENIAESVHGPASRDIIIHLILSVLVMVFGIGFCFVSFKYRTLTKQRKATLIQSQNPTIPQHGENIEMENRLYDIINETDMLDDENVQELETLHSYLDVIEDSNIRETHEVKRFENHGNLGNLMSTTQMHTQENKVDCLSLMSSDSTSSSDEFQQDSTQDYLNPYQSMIQSEISPPEVTEYLTLAPANRRIDSNMHNHQNGQKKNSLQHLRNLGKNAMTKTYENVLDVAYPSARPICFQESN